MSDDVQPVLRPALVFSWRPAGEFDEAAFALKVMAADKVPDSGADSSIVVKHVDDPSHAAALAALDNLIRGHQGAGILYVTAHGSDVGLHFTDSGPEDPIKYSHLIELLARHANRGRRLTLAMGSCFAAVALKPLLDQLPPFIDRFVGFTHKPSGRLVGQMLAGLVAGDDRTLFDLLSRAMHASDEQLTAAFRSNDQSEIEATFRGRQQAVEAVLDGFIAEAGRLLKPTADRELKETGWLMDYRRQADGAWREVDDETPPDSPH